MSDRDSESNALSADETKVVMSKAELNILFPMEEDEESIDYKAIGAIWDEDETNFLVQDVKTGWDQEFFQVLVKYLGIYSFDMMINYINIGTGEVDALIHKIMYDADPRVYATYRNKFRVIIKFWETKLEFQQQSIYKFSKETFYKTEVKRTDVDGTPMEKIQRLGWDQIYQSKLAKSNRNRGLYLIEKNIATQYREEMLKQIHRYEINEENEDDVIESDHQRRKKDDKENHDNPSTPKISRKESLDPNLMQGINLNKPNHSRQGFGQEMRSPYLRNDERLHTSVNSYNPMLRIPSSSQFHKIKNLFKGSWNGRMETFNAFKLELEGYYVMENVPFLTDESFHDVYLAKGILAANDDLVKEKYPYLTPEIVVSGRSHLYGAIQYSCKNVNHVQQHLMRYRAQNDGIYVWMQLLETYDNKGSVDIQLQTYEELTKVPYSYNYKGGIIAYLADFQQGYAGLALLGREYSEEMQLAQLKDNIFKNLEPENPIRIHLNNSCHTLKEWIKFLRKLGIEKDHYAGKISRRKAHFTTTSPGLFSNENKYDNESIQDIEKIIAFYVNQYQSGEKGENDKPRYKYTEVDPEQEYWIGPAMFRKLMSIFGRDSIMQLVKERRTIYDDYFKKGMKIPKTQKRDYQSNNNITYNQQKSKDRNEINNSNNNNTNQNKGSLARINNVVIEDNKSEGEISEESEKSVKTEDLIEQWTKDYISFAGIVTTIIEDNVDHDHDVDLSHVNRNIFHTVFKDPTLIFDSGADTCVIGKGWEIIAETGKYAGLVGFDNNYRTKFSLPIVHAYTTVISETKVIPIVVYHVVYNENAHMSLMSTCQLSHGGCMMDLTYKGYHHPDGSVGSHSIKFPSKEHIVEFEVQGALMVLNHRLPIASDNDIQVSDITPRGEWEPSEQNMANFELDPYNPHVQTDLEKQEKLSIFNIKMDKNSVKSIPTIVSPADESLGIQSDVTEKVKNIYSRESPVGMDIIIEQPEIFDEVNIAQKVMNDERIILSILKDMKNVKGNQNKVGVRVTPNRSRVKPLDPKKIQHCLNWLPIEVIKHTLNNTTQYAKVINKLPLQRHFKARFHFLNLHRLKEPVATDTYFSDTKALGGFYCAQVFFGIRSLMINVYGMKTESEGPLVYEDFLRTEGIPPLLRRDCSQMQQATDGFKMINRNWLIKDGWTEPHHQHQNPAELRGVRWLKTHAQILMNRVGSPANMWLFCVEHLADVHNISSQESLKWRTPMESRHGSTPDISAYLMFSFWEKIYYLDTEVKFPNSKELPGRFLGIAKQHGDAVTFKILAENNQVLIRSVIRSAAYINSKGFYNQRLIHQEDSQAPPNPTQEMSPLLPDDGCFKGRYTSVSDVDSEKGTSKDEIDCKEKGEIKETKDLQVTKNNEISEVIDLDTKDDEVENEKESNKEGVIKKYFEEIKPMRRSTRLMDQAKRLRRNNQRKVMNILCKTTSSVQGSKQVTKKKDQNKNCYNSMINDIEIKEITRNNPMLVSNVPIIEIKDDCINHDKILEDAHDLIGEFKYVNLDDEKETVKLMYNQQLEILNKNMNYPFGNNGDNHWDIKNVIKQKIKNGVKMLKVCNAFGKKFWVQMNAAILDAPLQCIVFARNNGLSEDDEWKWTKPYLNSLRKFKRYVYAFKAALSYKPKYKFGIQVPRSVKHALALDKINGNDFWRKAIKKELDAIMKYKTFRKFNDKDNFTDYKWIPYHFVFDVKFDLRRKARLVAGGNLTDDPNPDEDIYSGVVGIEFVRCLFLLASRSGLEVWATDVGNAYLNGINREKVYVRTGEEFGPEYGKQCLIIDKSLYGLKTAAARFHEHLSNRLRGLGFEPSKADPNLWLKNKGDHYEYIATYVDDLMIASKDPQYIIDYLEDKEGNNGYELKGTGPPEYYLGGDVILLNEHWQKLGIKWGLSAATYLKNVIPKLENLVGKVISKYSSPMQLNFHPELDESDLLDQEGASKYRCFIGSLNWTITLGRFDIQYATSSMARFNMAPRKGHLDGVIRIVGYLKQTVQLNPQLLVNHDIPSHDQYSLIDFDTWKEFYPDAEEEIPLNIPDEKGPKARITAWVDADHAYDQVTRRSVSGIIIMINGMIWKTYSKRQKTVESSTYGSELVAARIAVDLIIETRYTLRMLGVGIDGPTLMLGDNKSVVLNTSVPSSLLKKKHCAINYHRVREAIAAQIVRFIHIPSYKNIADCLTKPLAGNLAYKLLKPVMFANPGETLWPGDNVEDDEKKKESNPDVT